jgi:hypothetical protein
MSHDLTRWIEDAEARRYRQAAAFDGSWAVSARRRHGLSEAIAQVPSWFHALTHVGSIRPRDKC